MQWEKTKNDQAKFNNAIEDEDAYFKLIAYTGTLEQERRKRLKKTLNDPVISQGGDTFEEFYKDELVESAKRPARQIDYEALKPKNNKRTSNTLSISDTGGFKNRTDLREQFFEDHKLYREGQLQQKERMELYFVLEQMLQ